MLTGDQVPASSSDRTTGSIRSQLRRVREGVPHLSGADQTGRRNLLDPTGERADNWERRWRDGDGTAMAFRTSRSAREGDYNGPGGY